MKCANCEKNIHTLNTVKIKRFGIKTSVSFCCYQCYLDFWKDNTNFKPFQEWKIESLNSLNQAENQ